MSKKWLCSVIVGLIVIVVGCSQETIESAGVREDIPCTGTEEFNIVDAKSMIEDAHIQVYVDGRITKTGDGSVENPFQTVEEARDYLRHQKKDEEKAVVYLRGGEYKVRESFRLTEADSGTEEGPILYRNYPGEEVVLNGGISLDLDSFTPVHDPYGEKMLSEDALQHVWTTTIDLEKIGQASIEKEGFNWPKVPPAPELFVDGEAMTVARFPNDGFLEVASIVNEGFVPRTYEGTEIKKEDYNKQEGLVIEYAGITQEQGMKWSEEKEPWFFGFWRWDWAHDRLKLESIDTEQKQLSFTGPSYYGGVEKARYYGFNLLSELDQPGEWYLDNETGYLYYYPSGDEETMQLSLLSEPMIYMENVQYVNIQGMHFTNSRGTGIKLSNASNNRIQDCEFSFLGQLAVEVGNHDNGFDGTVLVEPESEGGRNNGVVNSFIHQTGAGGLSFMGGQRETLEKAGHYAINNHICDYSRLVRTYSPAVSISGVGHQVLNNEIHNAPHMAIRFAGNDHEIGYNEIYDVAYETSDVGVIYSVRDWTYRGHYIHNNYIHHIPSMSVGEGSYGIYLDDMMSSARIENNIFYKIDHYAFLVGGGRDNIIKNNLIVDTRHGFLMDARATDWAGKTAEPPNGEAYRALMNVPYQSELWQERYPELTNILEDEPKIPKGNQVTDNILLNTGKSEINKYIKKYGVYKNNIEIKGEANPKFTLRDDNELWKKVPDFEPIDFEQIGRQKETAY